MTTAKMTRKRALELAQKAILKYMMTIYDAQGDPLYAELAAALAYIENMARQKELL